MALHPATRPLLRSIGRRIAELRDRADLTQEQMAERMDHMAVEGYRRWERGSLNVTIDTLVRIATILKVDVEDFFKPEGS